MSYWLNCTHWGSFIHSQLANIFLRLRKRWYITMGNCFGKQSSDASFQGAGRTLGASQTNAAAPSSNARAAVPPKISSSAPGRTLGNGPPTADQSQSPGAAAARAAEVRLTIFGGGASYILRHWVLDSLLTKMLIRND